MNAVIACGGTGGHLFPGLAVAEVMRARGHDVLLFISEKEIDSVAVSKHPEFRFEKLPSVGLPNPFFPKVKTELTGTPIRSDLQRIDRTEARRRLGLREDLPTLLVMGGSQGASGINQAMIKSLPALQGEPLQVIHLTGARDERLAA